MAFKTWLPGLLRLMDLLCRYILRNKMQIQKYLPEADWPKLDLLLDACEVLRVAILPLIPSTG